MSLSDEGVDNEPGEARQTAGAGPHWRQGELVYMLTNQIKELVVYEPWPKVIASFIIPHSCAL